MEENQNLVPPGQTPEKQTLANSPELTCKFCHAPISQDVFFCPTCGKKLKEPPFKFTWAKFIGNMTLTILLPPLGIYPGIKHLRQPDQTAKILGSVYIIVTIIVCVVMVKVFVDFIDNTNKMLNSTYLMQDYINDPSGSVEEQTNELQQLGL